ncbi:MAG: LacI family DNA-binding transcriptional regulator [Candidatus Omnitrophota bacterium]
MTQKEISKILDISVSTVSSALRNSPLVKKETRERVIRLAQIVKYKPNMNARSLVTGKTYSVGIISRALSEPFYAELFEEIHHCLDRSEYVGLFSPAEDATGYRNAIEILGARGVDGIISGEVNAEELLMLEETDVPVVVYGNRDISMDCVFVDTYKSGYLATHHLIRLGHKKIGYIGWLSDYEPRFIGYRDALYQNNLLVKREWVIPGKGVDKKSGYQSMKQMLSLSEIPTAIFTHNDMVAIGAMRALSEARMNVPEGMAVVGCDNVKECEYLSVTLTTVEQSRREIARNLVSTLLARIDSKAGEQPQKIVIEPRLIIRESCGFYLKKSPVPEPSVSETGLRYDESSKLLEAKDDA